MIKREFEGWWQNMLLEWVVRNVFCQIHSFVYHPALHVWTGGGTHQSRPARHWLTTMKYLESHGFSIGKPVWSNRLGALNACRFTRTTWVSFHCLLVSWLEAGHSLSSLFITVTQSGVLGLQWVLINDSSWQLKAFRRMIFQFWAEIQTATQKYHSYISAPPSPLILYPQW